MRPYTERDKRYIAKHGTCLGKASLLDSDTYNKGRMFEQVVYTLYGQTWTLENTPFYKDGDITINEIKVTYEPSAKVSVAKLYEEQLNARVLSDTLLQYIEQKAKEN